MTQVKSSQYRADIDGLRAIAVLLVVIFHAGFESLSGGYIGVDVFFVISGYLITGILIKDISNNQFSFSNFYKRRIRRLMPALFATLAFTSVLAIIIMLPSDLLGYAYSLVSVLFSVSNIYFWRANGGYFEGNVQEVPLLHTWSLSVEEQYYIVWPLILLFGYKFFSNKVMILIMLIGIIGLLYLSEYVSHITFGAAYYLLPTRAFELLIGSVLAMAWYYIPDGRSWLNHFLSIFGLSCIMYSAFMLNEGSTFPGYNAFIPTFGAALLILSGKGEKGIINRILESSAFVKIGLISYSVYLVHWPIIAFTTYLGYELTLFISIAIIAASLILGWLCWKFIETPFRGTSDNRFKPTFFNLYLYPNLATGCFIIFIVLTTGIQNRFDENIIKMEQAVLTEPADLRAGCHNPSRLSVAQPKNTCVLGDTTSETHAFLIGDSHSNHYSGFFDVVSNHHKIKLQDYTLDACLPIFDLKWGHNLFYGNKCRERNQISKKYIEENNLEYVILAGNWPSEHSYGFVYNDQDETVLKEEFEKYFLEKFILTVDLIQASGAKVIIVKNISPSGHDSPKCPIKKQSINPDLNCDIDIKFVDDRDRMIERIFNKVAIHFQDVTIIDPKQIVCENETCSSVIENTPLYLDRNHLNDQGSRVLGKKFLELDIAIF